jgi:hypothetical protein
MRIVHIIELTASERKPYQDYSNTEFTAIVARIYKQDIKELGYSFE